MKRIRSNFHFQPYIILFCIYALQIVFKPNSFRDIYILNRKDFRVNSNLTFTESITKLNKICLPFETYYKIE